MTERLAPAQLSFAGLQAVADRGDPDALGALLDRLAARLGRRRVLRPEPRASHVPERAAAYVPALTPPPSNAPAVPPDHPARPLRLLPRPEPVEVMAAVPEGPPVRLRWRRVAHRVVRAEGPERIGGEWWDGAAVMRDYYVVETAEGRRLWLYRAGLYGAAARWYLHGLFG